MTNEKPNPRPAWAVTVEFAVQPGFAGPFMERLAVQAEESLREAGCSQFDVCVDPSDEHRVFLYELYLGSRRLRDTPGQLTFQGFRCRDSPVGSVQAGRGMASIHPLRR